jgi:Fe-S cluster biosynthesis and repair protein YggX
VRTVFCKRKKQELPGLERAPLYGPLGQLVLDNVSQEAWDEWKDMQLKIVNEYRLDLSERKHRETLANQMKVFLGLAEEGSAGALAVGTPDSERQDDCG